MFVIVELLDRTGLEEKLKHRDCTEDGVQREGSLMCETELRSITHGGGMVDERKEPLGSGK